MKTWLPWCLMGFALTGFGCRSAEKLSLESPTDLATSTPEFSEIPPAQTRFISFLDRPELQEGAGPVDAGIASEFTRTDSGLRYRILRNSSGKKPAATDTVSVNYRGWLTSGKVFDSSYERGKPTSFPLNNVIAGWTEGMQLVGEGGMIELWVPSKLGYGKSGSPGSIPAHANLHFVVELLDVRE
ncbi:MAG: FKBP-type peptidyl-prolyl cis-trans isomerase [Planctomycetota bacterium]